MWDLVVHIKTELKWHPHANIILQRLTNYGTSDTTSICMKSGSELTAPYVDICLFYMHILTRCFVPIHFIIYC